MSVFKTQRFRDAYAAIHGYAYQIDVTVYRWLLLQPNEVLELERGEDIDVIALVEANSPKERERCLQQVKVRKRPLNLKSPVAMEALANFAVHIRDNPGLVLRFRFISTTTVGRERERVHERYSGIQLWEALRLGSLDGKAALEARDALRVLLVAQPRPSKFDAATWQAFQGVLRGSDEDFERLIQSFEWGMGEPFREEVRRQTEATLSSHYSISTAAAPGIYRGLFMEVLDLLAQNERAKRIDPTDLERSLRGLNSGSHDSERFAGLEAMLGDTLRDIRDQTAHISPMLQEVRTIAGNVEETKSILKGLVAGLPGESDLVTYLQRLIRVSLAPCKASWQLLGATKVEVDTLAADSKVGWQFPWQDLTAAQPMRVLIADFGAGKSLTMARCLQRAASAALVNPHEPVPVYIRATAIVGDLEVAVRAALVGVLDPAQRPILVLVDGADEAGEDATLRLINEGRVLLGCWPEARLVIASRPLPSFDRLEEAMKVPDLGPDGSMQLIARFSQETITPGQWYSWPEALRDALKRPLYCILLGVHLRNRGDANPPTEGQLLFELVDRSLNGSRAKVERLRELLLWLAVQTLDRGTDAHLGEMPRAEAARAALLSTGLVRLEGRKISFTLHILAQWFAAQAITENMVDLGDVLISPARLERWRYAFVLLVGNYGGEPVNRVMALLARENPGLAGQIICAALTSCGEPDPGVDLAPTVVGQAIQLAMDAWRVGFGPLAQLVTPTWPDGRLAPLRVVDGSGHLIAHWMRGIDELHRGKGFHWSGSYGIGLRDQPAWAWGWTRALVKSRLDEIVRGPTLLPHGSPIWQEAVWTSSLKVLGRGGRYGEPLRVDETLEQLRRLRQQIVFSHPNWFQFPHHWLEEQLETLLHSGTLLIESPWPGPDHDPSDGLVYSMYSPERLCERTSAVFRAAAQAYPTIVSTWLPRIGKRMSLAALLPARLTGRISVGRRLEGLDVAPALEWLVEPLPEDSVSEVDFVVSERGMTNDEKHQRYEQAMVMRHRSASWLQYFYHSESLHDIFMDDPGQGMIEDWLRSDLRASNWL